MKKRNNRNRPKPAEPESHIYNPGGINPYDYEVGLLKAIRSKWQKTGQNKQSARDLMAEIAKFRLTYADDFKLIHPYFEGATSYFSDANKALLKFAESKLKQKDDHYFTEGINKLKQGLNYLIAQMEKEKETGSPDKN